MPSHNEMMGYEGKDSSLAMSTHSELEGGMNWSYQLEMTVSAKVDNLSSRIEKKLVSHMKTSEGYTECVIDKRNNTIYVYSIDGIDPSKILGYIQKNIDAGAR